MVAEIRGLNEECGVFGVWGHPDAPQITYYGLHSLQHRGQEGAGIVVTDGKTMQGKKGEGLVTDIFTAESIAELRGTGAIGHVRYSIGGADGYENVQPLLFRSQRGSLAICHNGNLMNAAALRHQLEGQGSIFQTTSDSEVLAHLIRRGGFSALRNQVKYALPMLKGAYAFLIMTETELAAALDPRGMRPLSLGRIGDGYVIASETCAFDIIGARFERDILPGELLVINDEGLHSEILAKASSRTICAMEYIYFSRPDSNIQGTNIHTARKKLGKQLARECPVEADVVTGVPDSSLSAAIGYAEESGIPYEMGLIKSRYVGRTFIEPSQSLREQGVKMKLSAVRGVVEGKRVAMVDDSFVRGTTGKRITHMLKEAGAKEVHVLISSPPILYPCFYGIDTLTTKELIAANNTIEEIREIIKADSLNFLSVEGMLEVLGCGHCLACFTGDYPTEIYPEYLRN
jgi:amidophosphoribosyltransferase